MYYTKITHGWCEQTFDFNGLCLEQRFISDDSKPIERRALLEEGEVTSKGELEDDELIQHPADLQHLESIEKFCPLDMVDPPKPLAKVNAEGEPSS